MKMNRTGKIKIDRWVRWLLEVIIEGMPGELIAMMSDAERRKIHDILLNEAARFTAD